MSLAVVEHRRNFSAANTNRDMSPDLWHDAPIQMVEDGVTNGISFFDDFVDLPTGKYTATQATAGTFALDGAADGGVALADCASTTVTQGINVQLAGAEFTAAAGRTIWFEARVKAADIATGPEFFLGLSIIDTSIIAASANSSTDYIGWESVTDDGVLLFAGEKAGTRATVASPHTLVEDTYVKLGFKVNGVTNIEHWVNNIKQSTTLVTANISVVPLAPSVVCQSDGATDSIVHLDWWRVLQANE